MKLTKLFLTATLFFGSALSHSWDGTASGKVNTIEVTSAGNYAFRVTLKDSTTSALTHCGSHTWAYLNKTSSNYETYVSALLAAKMAQIHVTIYSNKETQSGNDYCHIGHIQIQ